MQEGTLFSKGITGRLLHVVKCYILYKRTIVNLAVMAALHLPSASANQNPFGWDTKFRNKHFYQSIPESAFSPSRHSRLRQKRNGGNGEARHIFPIQE